MSRQRILPEAYVDGETVVGDGSINNPLRVIGTGGGGDLSGQEIIVTPSEPEPYGPGTNMPAGIIHDWTQTGLADHTNLEWRGADNQATVLTGIDATGIVEGAVRIFSNQTLSPGDAGSVVLVDENDSRVASLAINRICTPGQMDYKVGKQDVVVLQRRVNENGDLRWVVLSGRAKQIWMWVQGLALYPHLQVGSGLSPIVGPQDDWDPIGEILGGNPDQLGIDGGNVANSRSFTAWNIFTDAAGASVTGLLGTATNATMTDWGALRLLFNSGPGVLTLKHSDAASLVENRLILPEARDYELQPNCGALLWRPFQDVGLGVTVQWRMLGVSNEVFPSVNTEGRTTTVELSFGSEAAPAALAAGLTSDWNPGPEAVIRATTSTPASLVDGLVGAGDPLVGNEVRILKNAGAYPLVLINELESVSAAANQFTLPGPSCLTGSAPPVIVMPNAEIVLVQGTAADGGKWRVHGVQNSTMQSNVGESIEPAAFPGAAVDDYNPTDAVTGLQGRFAGVWRVSGAVGTQLTGIDATPAGLPAYQHGDRIMLINYGASMLIMHQGATSAAPNRIACPPGGANNPDYTLLNGATVWLYRDGINDGWIVEGARV